MTEPEFPSPEAFIAKAAELARRGCAEHKITHPGDVAYRLQEAAEFLAGSVEYDREQAKHDPVA